MSRHLISTVGCSALKPYLFLGGDKETESQKSFTRIKCLFGHLFVLVVENCFSLSQLQCKRTWMEIGMAIEVACIDSMLFSKLTRTSYCGLICRPGTTEVLEELNLDSKHSYSRKYPFIINSVLRFANIHNNQNILQSSLVPFPLSFNLPF